MGGGEKSSCNIFRFSISVRLALSSEATKRTDYQVHGPPNFLATPNGIFVYFIGTRAIEAYTLLELGQHE
jgi:hypothetical protein